MAASSYSVRAKRKIICYFLTLPQSANLDQTKQSMLKRVGHQTRSSESSFLTSTTVLKVVKHSETAIRRRNMKLPNPLVYLKTNKQGESCFKQDFQQLAHEKPKFFL